MSKSWHKTWVELAAYGMNKAPSAQGQYGAYFNHILTEEFGPAQAPEEETAKFTVEGPMSTHGTPDNGWTTYCGKKLRESANNPHKHMWFTYGDWGITCGQCQSERIKMLKPEEAQRLRQRWAHERKN